MIGTGILIAIWGAHALLVGARQGGRFCAFVIGMAILVCGPVVAAFGGYVNGRTAHACATPRRRLPRGWPFTH